uniref:Uncharacterized protein n=1 Tax=Timema poppense TaxID=170557 RepID=A0A7R9CH57_TIMPO|nr:unnamed protein product [Timema poppensis]
MMNRNYLVGLLFVMGMSYASSQTTVHPTEIRTSISPSSAAELHTTSALANYATEAGIGKVELEEVNPHLRGGRVENHLGEKTVHHNEIRTLISPSSAVELQHDKRVSQLRHRGGITYAHAQSFTLFNARVSGGTHEGVKLIWFISDKEVFFSHKIKRFCAKDYKITGLFSSPLHFHLELKRRGVPQLSDSVYLKQGVNTIEMLGDVT